MKKAVRLCKTCVRNTNSRFIESQKGQCIYCKEFIKHKAAIAKMMDGIKGGFSKEFKKKGTKEYDCLVMASGGKDSLTALYKIASETELRPLVYTADNGFEDETCLINVKNASEILEADWFIDRPVILKKTIKAALLEKVPYSICRFCVPIMINRAIRIAASFGIPYIVTGWNKGQSDKEPSRFPLWIISDEEIDKFTAKHGLKRNIGLKARENEKLLEKFKIKLISPWIFQERDPKKNIKFLKKEFDWKKTEFSYPRNSTSCKLNLLQVILSRKKFGYTHYDCEESMLISHGEKTRRQAIQTLNFDINKPIVEEVLSSLGIKANQIGLKKKDIERFSKFYF